MTSRRKRAGADEAPGAQGGERTAAKNPFFAKRIQRSLIGLRQWEEDDVAVERNKKRGGRPGTPDGKQWARRNAIKHGVFAQTPVVPPPRGREGPGAAAAGCARLVFPGWRVPGAAALVGLTWLRKVAEAKKGLPRPARGPGAAPGARPQWSGRRSLSVASIRSPAGVARAARGGRTSPPVAQA